MPPSRNEAGRGGGSRSGTEGGTDTGVDIDLDLGTATPAPAEHAEGRRLAEQIGLLQGNLLGIAAGNALIASALVLGLYGAVPDARLLPWLVAQLLHSGLNAWAWWRVGRRAATARSAPRRARAATASALVSGLLWAGALPLMWPADRLELQLLMICMLIGMTSGAMHSLTAHLPAFYAFLVPNVLAVSGMALWHAVGQAGGGQGSTLHGVVSATALVYGLTSARFAAAVHAAQVRGLRQRDALSALAANQQALAAELQASTADLQTQKDRAEQASVAKSRFLAAASHDLRQPVHALSLFLGALGSRPLDDETRRMVRHAGRSVDAMSRLFNALLDVSRLDAGMVQPELRTVALAPMLSRVAEEEGAVARAKGLRLVLRLPRGGAVLATRSDALLLERVVRNLVANAVRYTGRGGVLLALRRGSGSGQPSEGLRLQVWDTGVGISAEHQATVFQEFVQLHNPERDSGKGLGLGLAIVRRLVDLLGHPLTLRSVPGRGSVFSLRLPLAEAVVPEPPTLAGPTLVPLRTTGRLVLVVDDDDEIRAGMELLLRGWGHQVLAADGLAALMPQLAAQPRVPDLIISDYRLRADENGLDVVAALQAEYNDDIPAIVITGDTAAQPLHDLAAAGVLLLHKPVNPARLREAMATLLAAGTGS